MNVRQFIMVLVGLVCCGMASGKDVVVETFSGSGARNTRPFHVSDGWEVQWAAEGEVFQLYLFTADGDMAGVPANQQDPGKGASYVDKGGDYYLQVNALGSWDIRIVQVGGGASEDATKSGATTPVVASFSGSGGLATRPFVVRGPWEIQWKAAGNIFQIFLYATNGDLVGVAANQQGPGSGQSYQPKAGEYYLQMNALGSWEVRVVSLR